MLIKLFDYQEIFDNASTNTPLDYCLFFVGKSEHSQQMLGKIKKKTQEKLKYRGEVVLRIHKQKYDR